tara:strand:+ start:1797 stop:2621 length:825 start_codon:yes stop_codon:yes gene_type:complete
MKIGIIGQGFVGKAVYQKFKKYFTVKTFDIDESKCNTTFDEVIFYSDIIFMCLPTPMNNDGSCNINIVKNTLEEINKKNKKLIIILKSTVPPGTTQKLNDIFSNISIVFNPEFLTERNAVDDYINQNRIIIGGPRPSTTIIKQLFNKVFDDCHIIKTGSTHAEFIKYFTNCFLATKVSFSNEMYELSKSLDLDYDKIVEYAVLDKRLGKTHFNVPGPDGDIGFGGHCLPKDLNALVFLTEKKSTTNNVLKSVIKTNDKLRKNRDWEKMKGRAIN